MLDEKQIKVLEKAIEKYGDEKQILVAVEELSELQKELLKNINRNKDNIPDIILELADVVITTIQLDIIYNKKDSQFGEKLVGAVDYKVQRLKERLERGE